MKAAADNSKRRSQIGTYSRERYLRNREKILAQYQENKEAALAYQRERYQKNREALLARSREYYHKNREARLAYRREYSIKHKEAEKARKLAARMSATAEAREAERARKRESYHRLRAARNGATIATGRAA
jgi:hypothetical protein